MQSIFLNRGVPPEGKKISYQALVKSVCTPYIDERTNTLDKNPVLVDPIFFWLVPT